MKSNKQIKYSNCVAFSHFYRLTVNHSGSGVCLLVTKALEVELSKRFLKGFVGYIKSNYPGKSELNEWPAGLLDRAGNPSAHTGELNERNARDCFDLVLDVEKLLRRMLDSFNE